MESFSAEIARTTLVAGIHPGPLLGGIYSPLVCSLTSITGPTPFEEKADSHRGGDTTKHQWTQTSHLPSTSSKATVSSRGALYTALHLL